MKATMKSELMSIEGGDDQDVVIPGVTVTVSNHCGFICHLKRILRAIF